MVKVVKKHHILFISDTNKEYENKKQASDDESDACFFSLWEISHNRNLCIILFVYGTSNSKSQNQVKNMVDYCMAYHVWNTNNGKYIR